MIIYWGDGQSSSGNTYNIGEHGTLHYGSHHTYSSDGNYEVRIVLTDDHDRNGVFGDNDDLSASWSATITVNYLAKTHTRSIIQSYLTRFFPVLGDLLFK